LVPRSITTHIWTAGNKIEKKKMQLFDGGDSLVPYLHRKPLRLVTTQEKKKKGKAKDGNGERERKRIFNRRIKLKKEKTRSLL